MNRCLRISLRTLLLAMVIPCLWLGAISERARQQKATVAKILRAGGDVKYENEEFTPFTGRVVEHKPPFAGWLYVALGKDYFYNVTEFSGDVSEAGASVPYLLELPRLKQVRIYTSFGDSEAESKRADELVRALKTALPNTNVEHAVVLLCGNAFFPF